MEMIIVLASALVLDLLLGEPPLALHPVVWMGKLIDLGEKPGLNRKPAFQFISGMLLTLFVTALFALPVFFLLRFLAGWNTVAFVIAGACLFKTTFSLRELMRAALRIKRLLLDRNITRARFDLRALVKRDSNTLDEPLVVSAAVESVAENTCDSFVAPLFYFLLLGVPGAIAYRVINTFDAMIGRHGKYEYLGKFPARLDDVLNIIPARLSALLIVAAAFLLRQSPALAWNTMLRQHARTESPNAGWPMAAAAGALSVRFTKQGHYQLGEPLLPLNVSTIDSGLRLTAAAAFCWVIICFAIEAAFAAGGGLFWR